MTSDRQHDTLDLDAYLTRIGYDGERAPTTAALHALVRAHTTVIPFENVEALLGRPVPLDLVSLQDKLIRRRRGGWCYENAELFAAALDHFGFGVTRLSARVILGPVPDVPNRPATHALLRVTTADDERPWIADVGFGAGPLAPYPLADSGGEFALGAWRFRLEDRDGLWVLHQFGRDGWLPRYTFTTEPQFRIDYEVGNHYVATSPHSPFIRRPYAQRFHPDVHHILDGTTWTAEFPDGRAESRELELAELPKILAEVFDIDLDQADADRLTAAG